MNPRTDLFVTTSLAPPPELVTHAHDIARELAAPYAERRNDGLPKLWARFPVATRALLVQNNRLRLTDRTGAELFYHPNMSHLRLQNVLRGDRDLLLEAADLRPGERVLDCTLGYAAEAILCAYAVGEMGVVHGIEAVPEVGVIVREGLKTVVTENERLNQLMRQIEVVHIGHHLEYLRTCPDQSYDVVCFDPFFDVSVSDIETLGGLRRFGEHAPLLPEAIAHARRIARRRILVKAARLGDSLAQLGIGERVGSRTGKVVYGVLSGSVN